MKTFTLIIQSKNKVSNSYFTSILNRIISRKSYTLKKQFPKKTKQKKLTILKSPHVNKKAQEQFEIRIFRRQLTTQSIKNFKYLILLKNLSFKLFSDINIILKYNIKKKSDRKLNLKIFTPENFKLDKFFYFKNYNIKLKLLKNENISLKQSLSEKTILLLRILDVYGELFKYMFK